MEDIINNLPYELFETILKQTNGTTAVKCRSVCKKWRQFIDTNESLWRDICTREFEYASKIAKRKCADDLPWKDVYRNLKTWPRIAKVETKVKTFYKFNTHDKSHALDIDHSILALREAKGMVLYDMKTLTYMPVVIPDKNCIRLVNNEIVTVLLTKTALYVQKTVTTCTQATEAEFRADKFVLSESDLYFYNNRDIFRCDLKKDDLSATLLTHLEYDIAEIQHSDRSLHLFTNCGKIVSISNNGNTVVKTINCPEAWVRSIKHIKALDDRNFICYSRNLFHIETDNYKHLFLEFPPITALFFYGDIVLMGTRIGEILLYRLSVQQKAMKPIFETIARLPEEVFAVSLDVYERNVGPLLVVSTFFHIYLIEADFFPEEKEKPHNRQHMDKVPLYKRLKNLKERLT